MAKTNGQDEISPSEEKIEIMIEGWLGTVLAAMEKKMLECIEKFQAPLMEIPTTGKKPKVKSATEVEVDKTNAQRLGNFKEDRKKMQDKQIAEEKARRGRG